VSSITAGNATQYGDSRKLAARAALHKYTVAETPWFSWVAKQLPFNAGDRVLDIGCGPAWFWAATTSALPATLDLTLADLSPGMVQEALERCQALSFGSVRGRQADATAQPFGDGAFDAVIAMHMLYHVADPVAAIAEMHRVLKPGGFLAVTTNCAGNMRQLYALMTMFDSPPSDPAAEAFGCDAAEGLMRSQFGEVTASRHLASLRIPDPDEVFLALTSYPPGETAAESQKTSLRDAIRRAFERGNGGLEVQMERGLILGRKRAR
jgi:ubiquinone/menaquinone biosynthesis C-methylase UbiE